MAGSHVGHIGAYSIAYKNIAQKYETESNEGPTNERDDTVWVKKRYIPTDLRTTAPVPRHKLLSMTPGGLPATERHWMTVGEVPLASVKRENGRVFISHPSTRCEEWSTLRQMLPSRGSAFISSPPNWGTGNNLPPIMLRNPINRIPKVNSPMTRYVDAMHATNRLFRLN